MHSLSFPCTGKTVRKSFSATGFTLIELSIVLVIIGLIVGGVLVGQDLIRAAEVRSIISDIEKFNTAANSFKGKYGCVPGDCANATQFFPDGAGECTGDWEPSSYELTHTCNGNGDGVIEEGNIVNGINESTLFWQHLAMAGLIPGNYTANYNTAPVAPYSSIPTLCYSIAHPAEGHASILDTYNYPSTSTNVFTFGSPNLIAYTALNSCTEGYGGISTAEAYSIDSKLDDGIPNTGNVTTLSSMALPSGFGLNPCHTVNAPITYNLTQSGPWCMLIFNTQF